MVREFKKTGVAAALTGALLATASISSQAAVQLSAPGDVVLVPYVVCENPTTPETRKNTLVGITTYDKARLGFVSANNYLPAPVELAGVADRVKGTPYLPKTSPTGKTSVHWYFFDSRSVHRLDSFIPATDNDFLRFDWCETIKKLNATDLYGVKGYMLFVDDTFDRSNITTTQYALYGHSYQIVGNWASQAFIPVVATPTYSIIEGVPYPVFNVIKSGGYPKIVRFIAGTNYTAKGAPADRSGTYRDVYMRYFLDPALATSNDMVFWFNTNEVKDGPRYSVSGETYDSEQNYIASFSYPLPDELNVVHHTPDKQAFPGMIHTETETYGDKSPVINSGVIRLGIPQNQSHVGYYSSGMAFNMLGLGAGANKAQIQTEMATESVAY